MINSIQADQKNKEEEEEEEAEEEEVDDTEFVEHDEYPFLLNAPGISLRKYEKNAKIGDSFSSKIYQITDRQTGDLYTAKIFIDAGREDQKTFLAHQVEIHSRVNHAAILKFIGYSPTDFKDMLRPVIVTEHTANGSLDGLIMTRASSFFDDTLKLINIFGVASAMSYLHSLNFIHRDLKPSNIVLDEHLFPKICGFDLSTSLSTQKENDLRVVGTASFIAPEILQDSKYSKASDVYAFAIVVYEILTEMIPFENCAFHKIIYDVSMNRLRPEIPDHIPEAYRRLIMSCWAHDPDDRPSFKWIVNDLKTNRGFITENVNEELYRKYIEYIEQGHCDEIKDIFQTYSIKQTSENYE